MPASFTPLDILRKNYDTYHAEWRAAHGTDAGAEICVNKIIHRPARRPSSTASTAECARTCCR